MCARFFRCCFVCVIVFRMDCGPKINRLSGRLTCVADFLVSSQLSSSLFGNLLMKRNAYTVFF